MALSVWFQEDIAAAIVAVMVARDISDSRDLRALASVMRIPWAAIQRAYREQEGAATPPPAPRPAPRPTP